MSILYENEQACFISHEKFLKHIYEKVDKDDHILRYEPVNDLFNIQFSYVKNLSVNRKHNRKRKPTAEEPTNVELLEEINHVKDVYNTFKNELLQNGIIVHSNENGTNKSALEMADYVYHKTGKCNLTNISGENSRNTTICVEINGDKFIFPKRSKFYCCNVNEIGSRLNQCQYDVILLDPPWWNKYIRRKKLKTSYSYKMMFNDDLKDIPIENLIDTNGLVVVWCTNAKSHLNDLQSRIFKKWGVKYFAKWFWLKVTSRGEPVCNFSEPPGKQPFEQILFASKNPELFSNIEDKNIIISVPSALHSHKPPVIEVLKKFLPENPRCLEVFARYLLPDCTSYGLEAIKFQHESLYTKQCKQNLFY